MNANKHELLLQKEVYAVVGCALEVLNVRGHGLHEKVYENCLCVEFRLRNISYNQQERHQVLYKGELVGEYIPDLVVQHQLIVDTKTIDRITDHEAWSDAELSPHHRATRWDHPEFQARASGVGASRANQRSEIRGR
jgi:GxxExxY protein